jgi:NitT/TauT family transport system permease protein
LSRAVQRLGPPAAALLLSCALWELLVRALRVPLYLLPPPSAIAEAAFAESSTLARATVVTGRAAVLGFVLSGLAGIAAGVLMAASRVLERALAPYTVFLQTVPIVAVAPLLVIWFGPGLRAVTMSAVIVSVFPVVAGTLSGIRSIEPAQRDLFRLYRASRWQTLRALELPSALPSIITGLRVASGLAVIGAIVGEFVAGFSEGGAGLGITVLSAYRQMRTDLLFAAVLLSSALGLALFSAVNAAGYLLLRKWHASEKS